MEVSMPSFLIGCKHPPLSDGESFLKDILTAELALEMIAGHSCPLYFRLYNSGLIDSGFSASVESEAGAAHSILGGDSCDPDKVFDEIKKEARLLAKDGPDEGLFSRVKKAAWGGQLRATGSPERLCIASGGAYFRGYDYFLSMDALESVTIEDVRTFFRDHLVPENMAISIVKPKA
jgi:predicted Zn-dependent peptidase